MFLCSDAYSHACINLLIAGPGQPARVMRGRGPTIDILRASERPVKLAKLPVSLCYFGVSPAIVT